MSWTTSVPISDLRLFWIRFRLQPFTCNSKSISCPKLKTKHHEGLNLLLFLRCWWRVLKSWWLNGQSHWFYSMETGETGDIHYPFTFESLSCHHKIKERRKFWWIENKELVPCFSNLTKKVRISNAKLFSLNSKKIQLKNQLQIVVIFVANVVTLTVNSDVDVNMTKTWWMLISDVQAVWQ